MTALPRLLLDPGPHFFLFGPRGTGKSTWLGTTFPGATVVDLLDPEEHRRYAARPERLRELVAGASPGAVFVVDEVQRVPALLTVVHQLIEARGGARFVLTGSSARKLRRKAKNLMGGRAIDCQLFPLTSAEIGSVDLDKLLSHGALPVHYLLPEPAPLLKAYVNSYIKEEIWGYCFSHEEYEDELRSLQGYFPSEP